VTVAPLVYLLSVLVTLACGFLLLRAYVKVRQRLLLWSGLCFVGLTASNVIVVVDLVLLPDLDLYVWRLAAAAFSMLLLVYGLVWESD
jgi:hypothetical protein